MKLNKIFAKSEEKFVKTVIVYVDGSLVGVDDVLYAYKDADLKEKFDKDELFNLLVKGMAAVSFAVSGIVNYAHPSNFGLNNGVTFGTFLEPEGTDAVMFASEEFVPEDNT